MGAPLALRSFLSRRTLKTKASPNPSRLLLIQGMALAVLLLTAVRVVWVHLVWEGRLSAMPTKPRGRSLEGPRGSILDRDGRPLALSTLSYDVELDCFADRDFPPELGEELLSALSLDHRCSKAEARRVRDLFRVPKKARSDRGEGVVPRYVWTRVLAKGIQSREALEALLAIGKKRFGEGRFRLRFLERWRRSYPLGRAAAQVVGFVGSRANGARVATGLEAQRVLNRLGERREILRNGPGGRSYVVGKQPLALPVETPTAGIRTTLDSGLQEAAFRAIHKAVQTAEADWGMIFLADLRSGDLLALAAAPSFDPEHRRRGDRYYPYTHYARFEPGSCIKPLVLALALQRGLVHPGEIIPCHGDGAPGSKVYRIRSLRGRGRVRTITDDHLVGPVPLAQVLVQSSNIGAVRIGMRGGVAFHRELLTLFGLDRVPSLGLPINRKKDSLGMPAPIRGSLPDKSQFREPSPYHRFTGPSLSMGYQYLIYPLTFGEAFCTVLTGREFRFRLVSSLEDVSGERIDLPQAGPGKRVLRPEVSRWIRDTLLQVVGPHGTGRSIAGPGVTGVIGGKTGTSFRRMGEERSYTASFAGFAPGADNPRYFAFALLQKKPAYKFYGGKYAAPAVRDLLLATLEQEGGAEEFPQEKGEEDGFDVRVR